MKIEDIKTWSAQHKFKNKIKLKTWEKKHCCGARLYPKLMLNKLKVTWGEFLEFVNYWGPNSKKNISKNSS